MGRAMFLIWASFILLSTAVIANGLGVTWGRLSSQKLLPSAVVDMLLANGMDKVKFYSTNLGVLDAFVKSNISVMTTVPQGELKLVDTKEKAVAWVKENVTDIHSKDVKLTHVCIGNEPYMKANASSYVPDENDETTYVALVVKAFKGIDRALQEQKHKYNIKASIPFSTEVLKPDIIKPSKGDFREEMKENMTEILRTLNSSGSPFMVNIYPHYHIREKGYPIEFAYFEEDNKNFTIKDGKNVYTNVFDATFDTFVSALRKNGFPNIEIIVQVGWPTDGDLYANDETAEKFYRGFLKKLFNKKGTPLYPKQLDVFIFSLVDENSRPIQPRGYSDRHYGIYFHDGNPKYHFNFNCEGGKHKELEPAQGISYMPQRWCVFNNNNNITVDDQLYEKLFGIACRKADCSSLMYGGSCNGALDRNGNLSYAFNMYFQRLNQKVLEGACNIEGYGVIVTEDPSIGTCKFPVQILSTIFVGGQGEMGATLASNGGKLLNMAFKMIIFVPFVFVLFLPLL